MKNNVGEHSQKKVLHELPIGYVLYQQSLLYSYRSRNSPNLQPYLLSYKHSVRHHH